MSEITMPKKVPETSTGVQNKPVAPKVSLKKPSVVQDRPHTGVPDLYNLNPEPMMPSQNPATEALFELTNLDKIKLMSQTDDHEISMITRAIGIGKALELCGINVNEDIAMLLDEKFQLRVSNKRLGRAEQIEGVRSESGSSPQVLDVGEVLRKNFDSTKKGIR
jgi:hypothetical protein